MSGKQCVTHPPFQFTFEHDESNFSCAQFLHVGGGACNDAEAGVGALKESQRVYALYEAAKGSMNVRETMCHSSTISVYFRA